MVMTSCQKHGFIPEPYDSSPSPSNPVKKMLVQKYIASLDYNMSCLLTKTPWGHECNFTHDIIVFPSDIPAFYVRSQGIYDILYE